MHQPSLFCHARLGAPQKISAVSIRNRGTHRFIERHSEISPLCAPATESKMPVALVGVLGRKDLAAKTSDIVHHLVVLRARESCDTETPSKIRFPERFTQTNLSSLQDQFS